MSRQIAVDGIAPRWGRLTIDRWMRMNRLGVHLHVFLDGADVSTTHAVWEADDDAGTVDVYVERGGEKFKDPATGQASRETLRGAVEIRQVAHDGPCRASRRAN